MSALTLDEKNIKATNGKTKKKKQANYRDGGCVFFYRLLTN